MKRSLSVVLRIVIAAAGIAFILLSVTWTDQAHFPADTPVQAVDGTEYTFEQAQAFPVGRLTPQTIEVNPHGEADLPPQGVVFARSIFTGHAGEPRFEPGILTMLRQSNGWLLGLGLVLTGFIMPVQAARWLVLMRCRGIQVSYGKAFRLTMVGLFFNFCLPGSTGGDVVKAYYAAKGSTEKPKAVMSVVFDRITGLVALLVVAAMAGVALLLDPTATEVMREVVFWLWVGMAAVAVAGMVYFSHTLRRRLGIEKLMTHWHAETLIRRIDAAAHAYRHHAGALFGALALAGLSHVFLVGATICAGWALGIEHGLTTLSLTLPILIIAGSVPLTYQGLGIVEGLGLVLLEVPGLATSNQVVGMLVLMRLYQVLYGLLGSVIMLRGDIHLHPQFEAENLGELASKGQPQTG